MRPGSVSKKRATCTHCERKFYVKQLAKVYYKLLKKYAYHCPDCLSLYQDKLQMELRGKSMYLLELFSGSKIVSSSANEFGFKTFTIDIEKKYSPDMVANIAKLKINDIPERKQIMIIWASLPCTNYSILNIKSHWQKLIYASRKFYYIPTSAESIKSIILLERTLHIIKSINPIYFFIENPRGALRHMPQMSAIPFMHSVSYSDYGLQVYKPTDIFTNCPFLQLTKIKTSVGQKFAESVVKMNNAYERSIVPGLLVKSIIAQIKQHHNL